MEKGQKNALFYCGSEKKRTRILKVIYTLQL